MNGASKSNIFDLIGLLQRINKHNGLFTYANLSQYLENEGYTGVGLDSIKSYAIGRRHSKKLSAIIDSEIKKIENKMHNKAQK